MLKDGKYIIVSHQGMELPILFSKILSHAECIPRDGKVVSGGSFRFTTDGKVDTYGYSATANVKWREGDSEIIYRAFLKKEW